MREKTTTTILFISIYYVTTTKTKTHKILHEFYDVGINDSTQSVLFAEYARVCVCENSFDNKQWI